MRIVSLAASLAAAASVVSVTFKKATSLNVLQQSFEQDTPPTARGGESFHIPLDDLTHSSYNSCRSEGLVYVDNRVVGTDDAKPSLRKIPKIVHQSGKTRCLTPAFFNLTDQWRNLGYTYYFHDDEAVDRLFRKPWPEIPVSFAHILQCALVPVVRADLWRYLMLWEYGGVYTDIDSFPNSFNETLIHDEDDGFFLLDRDSILSQWFIAVSPKHPLMYYAIMETVTNVMRSRDPGIINPVAMSGPIALHNAMVNFMADAGVKVRVLRNQDSERPLNASVYVGAGGRSLRVVGDSAKTDEYIQRDLWDGSKQRNALKLAEYEKMGMEHWNVLYSKRRNELKRNCTCKGIMWSSAAKSLHVPI